MHRVARTGLVPHIDRAPPPPPAPARPQGFARVKALDEVVAKAKEASKEELKKVVDALEAAAKALEGEGDKAHGALYVKLAKKAADKVRAGSREGVW